MAKYWTGKPQPIESSLVPQYGCHVFGEGRAMAICNAYGRSAEEAHDEAHRIIACLYGVENIPSAAAKARHYIVRSPKLTVTHKDELHGPSIADVFACVTASAEWTEQRNAYEGYFERCETANKVPLTFEDWKAGRHE